MAFSAENACILFSYKHFVRLFSKILLCQPMIVPSNYWSMRFYVMWYCTVRAIIWYLQGNLKAFLKPKMRSDILISKMPAARSVWEMRTYYNRYFTHVFPSRYMLSIWSLYHTSIEQMCLNIVRNCGFSSFNNLNDNIQAFSKRSCQGHLSFREMLTAFFVWKCVHIIVITSHVFPSQNMFCLAVTESCNYWMYVRHYNVVLWWICLTGSLHENLHLSSKWNGGQQFPNENRQKFSLFEERVRTIIVVYIILNCDF